MAERRGKETQAPDGPFDSNRDTDLDSGANEPDRASSQGIPDLVRRALTAGLSGFFVTEEVVRRAVGDTLPKDWSDFAVEQSERTRAEFIERLSYEIGRSIENIDLAAVFAQLLEGRTLEVNATVRLSPPEKGQGGGLRLEVESAPRRKPRQSE